MTIDALFPLISALLCAEIAMVFVALYFKVSRRDADLIFAALSLTLGVVAWGTFLSAEATDPAGRLFALRTQYCGGFAAATVFVHFVSAVVREPLRPFVLVTNYVVGTVFCGIAGTDLFLHLPQAGDVSEAGISTQGQGPLYPIFIVMLLLAAAAWLKLMRGFRRRGETAFSPLSSYVPFIFVAGALIILAGAAIAVNALVLPLQARIPPHIAAVMVFCLFTAVALGKEMLRGETEKQRLADAVQFRNQAVRDVAHELRNPLAAVRQANQTVLHGMDRGMCVEDQRELVRMGADTCQRLTRLLNNMLDTARMEAGRDPELRLEQTDLRALVESVTASQQLTTASHHLSTQIDLRSPIVCLDADKVYQVLSNLIDNAVKYSPHGGEICLRVWEADDEVLFSVTDHGVGIPPEQQQRIFEPFERLADPERRITGTGIGLHLVHRLVEAHGGRIRVESTPDAGSTFFVSLPVPPSSPDTA